MRFTRYTLAAGVAVVLSAAPALAFGRGGFAAHGARVGPAGGVRAGGVAHGAAVGPLGGAHARTVHGGSYAGPGGASIQHVGGAGATRGPLGGVHVGGGGATRVTGPGGHTTVTGHGGGASAGPLGGVSVHGGRGAAVGGPGGVAVGGARGGAAIGPVGGVVAGGSRGGAVATPWGATGGFARGGVAVGGARFGHATGYISPVTMHSYGYGVRTAGYYPYFNRTWYAGHATAWVAPRWVAGYSLWAPPLWNTVATFVGVTTPPVSYDYGSTIVINDNSVYVNGESAGTPEEYATQATEIADTGRAVKPAETDEWQPLGVFGLVQPEDKVAQRIFQIAVNKAGVLRGNYYDAVADSSTPIYGSVDKKTQRVAWSIGEKKDIVFETGLPNLTKDESTVLIHYGKDRSEQQMLVRVEEPKDKK